MSNYTISSWKTPKKKSPVSSKKIADEFKKNGISVIKALSTDEISKLIKDANDAYYNSDEPFLSDNQYDIVREYLESIDPQNPVLTLDLQGMVSAFWYRNLITINERHPNALDQ